MLRYYSLAIIHNTIIHNIHFYCYTFSTLAAQVLNAGMKLELSRAFGVLKGPFVSKFACALIKWIGIHICPGITLFVMLERSAIMPRFVDTFTISPSFISIAFASFCEISTNG